MTVTCYSHEDPLLRRQIGPDDVSDLPVPLHVLLDDALLLRPPQVADQRLDDVIAVHLVSELTQQHRPLLPHLLHLALRAYGIGGEMERNGVSTLYGVFSNTVEPHLSGPQLSGCSDYPTIELMMFIGFLLCIK